MPTINASYSRDNNRVPVTTGGITSQDNQTLTGSNATVAVPIFGITGSIQVTAIWGVITTTLGANHTAAYWRLNDQAAQANITLNTGTTLSGAVAGSVIVKKGLATAALTLLNNSSGVVSEPTTLETEYFSPFVFVKKTAANTNIEYVYTTTDTPTSGVIQFFIKWLPVSLDSSVSSL